MARSQPSRGTWPCRGTREREPRTTCKGVLTPSYPGACGNRATPPTRTLLRQALYEEGVALQAQLETRFDNHAQRRLDVQRCHHAMARWQERQELETAARVSAAESLASRKGILRDLEASLRKEPGEGAKAKLKVVEALLRFAEADVVSRLARGEVVPLGLCAEDVDAAGRAS